jgi:hypothetical protein
MLVLVVAGSALPSRLAAWWPSDAVHALRRGELSRHDARQLQRGYYEDLVGASRFNTTLWSVYSRRPKTAVRIWDTAAGRRTGDYMTGELVPNTTVDFRGARMTTNEWGMRDRAYERDKPADTWRVAVVGASIVMGWGVGDEETFEARMEAQLENSREHAVEILNFGVPGYTPGHYLQVVNRKVHTFRPDVLLVVAHGSDESETLRHLADAARDQHAIPHPELARIVAHAGVTAGTPRDVGERRLKQYGAEVISIIYRDIARSARERGITPVWVLLPTFEAAAADVDLGALAQHAAAAGFEAIDLTDVFDGHTQESLQLAEWDWHPNARAHQMLADRLVRELRQRPHLLPGSPGAP